MNDEATRPKYEARPRLDGLVSVLVPVYNRADLIEDTLRSALSQTYESIEVVVVDNASTDGTWQKLTRLAGEDGRLRIFRNPSNLGPVRNWLACVEQARGVFCKILWSDDLISPEFIASTVKMLQNPDVGFVYTATRIFTDSPSDTDVVVYATPGEGLHPSANFIEGSLMGGDFPVSPGCAILRTADVRKHLLLNVPNRIGSDFSMHAIGNDLLLLLLTAANYPRVGLVARPLSQFRSHAGSITTTSASGRLQLHYDVAKAAFVEMTHPPLRLVRRFNASLKLDLMRFNGQAYGLHSVADFYQTGNQQADILALLQVALARVFKKVATRFPTRSA